MKAKFYVERWQIEGRRGVEVWYKVTGWEGIKEYKDLPWNYLYPGPCFYLEKSVLDENNNWVVIYDPEKKEHIYIAKLHSLFPKEEWENRILPLLKESGRRLSEIHHQPCEKFEVEV